MSRIFISHSAGDELPALALRQWLAAHGWDDVFLDVDPRRGLVAGERWQEALRRAAHRCEAVVVLISAAWAASKWCLAEYLLARSLHKLIFAVLLEDVPVDELPRELTAEWQLCRLVGAGPALAVSFTHGGRSGQVDFLADGLERLAAGLQRAGLSADYFDWPPASEPDRAPYRGLEPIDHQDAAVFFGRDAEIAQGLDRLRAMRDAGDRSLFVILGASGAGKSSFMRAGLLPRLGRDGRHFLTLGVMRPERAPLNGERGLADVLAAANRQLGLAPVHGGAVKALLARGGDALARLLEAIRLAAATQPAGSALDTMPPTIVLPVDQAEELFNADATDEAQAFLHLLGNALRTKAGELPLIVMLTIRSEHYEPLQTAPALAGLATSVFDGLRPMPPAQYREVIVGPARRASVGGRRLEVAADLVQRLLSDGAQGADALPLLGLTLSRLWRDYGAVGELRLAHYIEMGGMSDVIRREAEAVLSGDPAQRSAQLKALRAAFVPWLATIHVGTGEPMRRVERLARLPAESRPLIRALIDRRLLLTDLRDGEAVVEVAHESLLRHWSLLAGWLREQREDLKDAERLELDARAWGEAGSRKATLWEGERLANAEVLAGKPGFGDRLAPTREFLQASRAHETRRRAEAEQLARAELEAARGQQAVAEAVADEQRRATARALADALRLKTRGRQLLGLLLLTTLAAALAWRYAREAQEGFQQATALRLAAEAPATLQGGRAGGGTSLGLLELLTAYRLQPRAEIEAAMVVPALALHRLEKVVDTDEVILSVAFSPNGKRLVTGSWNNSLQQWDAVTGQPIGGPMRGHGDMVQSVAFSPDGRRIVSAGNDKTVRVWDTASGAALGEPLYGHQDMVMSVAFSPDGTKLVSGSADRTLRLWDTATGQAIGVPISTPDGQVWSVAVDRSGSRIASGGADGVVRLWDAATGRSVVPPLRGHRSTVWSVAFSPDGTRLVSGSNDMTLQQWNVATGAPLGEPMRGHQGEIRSVAYSPDGRRIVSGSSDKTVRLWDAGDGRALVRPLQSHGAAVLAVAFSPDGRHIASGSWDKSWRLWNATADAALGEALRGHSGAVLCVAFSPDGHTLLSGGRDATVRLWDAHSGQARGAPLQGHVGDVTAVAFSPDGKRFATAGADATLRLWDAASARQLGVPMAGHEGQVWSLAFSPDGSRIVSGGDDRTLRLWNAASGQPVGSPWYGHQGRVWSVVFSADGRRVVSGSWDGTLRLWDAELGRPIGKPVEGLGSSVLRVLISPDGQRLAASGDEGILQRWEAASGQPVGAPMRGHSGAVAALASSPDGKRFLSGGYDAALRWWDAASGEPIGVPMHGHDGEVLAVAVNGSGTRVVSAGADGTLRLWPATTAWAADLCSRLTRNLSRQEWRSLVAPGIDYMEACPGLPVPPDADKAPQR